MDGWIWMDGWMEGRQNGRKIIKMVEKYMDGRTGGGREGMIDR